MSVTFYAKKTMLYPITLYLVWYVSKSIHYIYDDVPSHYTRGTLLLCLVSLSLLASAAVVNYSKWNKNGTCLLADKSLTCPACGVTRVAWSTTKIQLTSGTASLHRHRTALWGCAADCCCAMSSRKDIWDLAKQHMAGVYDYNFSWPTKISFLSSVHYTPFTNFNTWIH